MAYSSVIQAYLVPSGTKRGESCPSPEDIDAVKHCLEVLHHFVIAGSTPVDDTTLNVASLPSEFDDLSHTQASTKWTRTIRHE
jgi:hypothetical protein